VSRFQFVEDHRDTYEVKRLCELVEIERSSYYAWRAAAPARAARAAADTELAGRIRAVHEQDNTLGAPRMTAELNDAAAAGERVNHKRVARVMRAERIRGYQKRRRVRTTIPQPSGQHVPDLLQRDFTAAAPNCRYVGDITYLPIADGSNLYLATVIDCYSRRLVGWSIADHMRQADEPGVAVVGEVEPTQVRLDDRVKHRLITSEDDELTCGASGVFVLTTRWCGGGAATRRTQQRSSGADGTGRREATRLLWAVVVRAAASVRRAAATACTLDVR